MQQPIVNEIIPVQIATDELESSVIELGGRILVGISIPTGFVASDISFLNSVDGTEPYQAVNDNFASEISFSAQEDNIYLFPVGSLVGLQFVKLKTSIVQTSDLTLNIITRPV